MKIRIDNINGDHFEYEISKLEDIYEIDKAKKLLKKNKIVIFHINNRSIDYILNDEVNTRYLFAKISEIHWIKDRELTNKINYNVPYDKRRQDFFKMLLNKRIRKIKHS